ncbi:MAG: hypothetical protein ACPHID_07380 [Thermoplasmatota archaeon]
MACAADMSFVLAAFLATPLAAAWGAWRTWGTRRIWIAPLLWGVCAALMALLGGSFASEALPSEPCNDTGPEDALPPLSDRQVALNTASFAAIGLAAPAIIAWMHGHQNKAQLGLLATMPLVWILVVALNANPQGVILWVWIAGVLGWLACLPGWLERIVPQTGQPSAS